MKLSYSHLVPYILAAGVAVNVLAGCEETERRRELSNVSYDIAIVAQKIHKDSVEGLALGIALNNIPLGIAMSGEEENYIFLNGKERNFRINDKELFKEVEIGDRVDIEYQECRISRYRDTDGDGKKDFIDSKPCGYVIKDARKVK